MAVAVETDFVTGVPDHGAFFGEGLEGVAGDEPGCFDVVFFEELEEAAGAYCAGEQSCGELSARCTNIVVAGPEKCWAWIAVPLLMSFVLSSPPYEPNQPATASMSTP